MIYLHCPNCGKRFPVFLFPGAVAAEGSCACGLDYAVTLPDPLQADVRWRHDPKYAQSGTEDYHETYSFAP